MIAFLKRCGTRMFEIVVFGMSLVMVLVLFFVVSGKLIRWFGRWIWNEVM